jgi:hypothetical protein
MDAFDKPTTKIYDTIRPFIRNGRIRKLTRDNGRGRPRVFFYLAHAAFNLIAGMLHKNEQHGCKCGASFEEPRWVTKEFEFDGMDVEDVLDAIAIEARAYCPECGRYLFTENMTFCGDTTFEVKDELKDGKENDVNE